MAVGADPIRLILEKGYLKAGSEHWHEALPGLSSQLYLAYERRYGDR